MSMIINKQSCWLGQCKTFQNLGPSESDRGHKIVQSPRGFCNNKGNLIPRINWLDILKFK